MSWPDGVTTTEVTLGPILNAGGEAARLTARLELDDPARVIVHEATGTTVLASAQAFESTDGTLTLEVPKVDQDGFLGADGEQITGWGYRLEITASWGVGRATELVKRFQPLVGDDEIDLDTLPDGEFLAPVYGPTPTKVVSVAGLSDVITADELIDALFDLLTAFVSDKAEGSHTHTMSDVVGLVSALAGKATAAQGALADTAIQPAALEARINLLIDAAPGLLNTLGEIATFILENEDILEALVLTVATKASQDALDEVEADALAAVADLGDELTDLIGDETTARMAADAGLTADIASASTADRARANHTGQQPSSTISDFTEAVQDAVGAALSGTTGATVTYDDAAGTIVIAGVGDPETMRDTIGAALVGIGLVTVTVDDAGNTITISTTATANDTDANLRARSSHTGTQAASTITGLAAVATSGAKADVGLGSVDNTTDAGKPVSTAQAAAIAAARERWQAVMLPLDIPVSSSNAMLILPVAGVANAVSYVNLATVGGTVTFRADICPGTWSIRHYFARLANFGQCKIEYSLDNGGSWATAQASIEQYAAATTTGLSVDTTGIVIPAGVYTILLKFTSIGKNASSTAYYINVGESHFTRTA